MMSVVPPIIVGVGSGEAPMVEAMVEAIADAIMAI
jgi:hypothetical protein